MTFRTRICLRLSEGRVLKDMSWGVAVEADAETLVETLSRSRFTFLNN